MSEKKTEVLFINIKDRGNYSFAEVPASELDAAKVEIVSYVTKTKRVRKFLYLVSNQAEILLVGLFPRSRSGILSHHELMDAYKAGGGVLSEDNLEGAGNISIDQHSVSEWESEGFKFITPEGLHARILELLGFS